VNTAAAALSRQRQDREHQLGKSRCRDSAPRRPSPRRVTAPGCYGQAERGTIMRARSSSTKCLEGLPRPRRVSGPPLHRDHSANHAGHSRPGHLPSPPLNSGTATSPPGQAPSADPRRDPADHRRYRPPAHPASPTRRRRPLAYLPAPPPGPYPADATSAPASPQQMTLTWSTIKWPMFP
jgi:hypothetical protein